MARIISGRSHAQEDDSSPKGHGAVNLPFVCFFGHLYLFHYIDSVFLLLVADQASAPSALISVMFASIYKCTPQLHLLFPACLQLKSDSVCVLVCEYRLVPCGWRLLKFSVQCSAPVLLAAYVKHIKGSPTWLANDQVSFITFSTSQRLVSFSFLSLILLPIFLSLYPDVLNIFFSCLCQTLAWMLLRQTLTGKKQTNKQPDHKPSLIHEDLEPQHQLFSCKNMCRN